MISVNRARNLVLYLLSKNSYGYIGVDELNQYFTLAQNEIFEQLFFDYNAWLNKQNRRLSNSEYANIPQNIQEVIDIFSAYSTDANFTYDDADNVWSYTGNDFYRYEGLTMVNSTTSQRTDIELVNKSELNKLLISPTSAPTFDYPVFVRIGEDFRIYPTLEAPYTPELFYIRKPKDVKYTYVLVNGNPVFNPAADLQDIELPESQFGKLITKTLGYCGLSLREVEVEQVANTEEAKSFRAEQP